jgi:hypothetical protein
VSIFARAEQNLYQIRCKVTQLPVFVENKGVKADDPAYWERINELDNLKSQLSLVIRDLVNAQLQLDVQQRNIPPSVRGQARQDMRYRIGQRKAEAFGLMLEAQKVLSLVEDLSVRNGLIDADEGAEDLIKMGFQLYDQLSTHAGQEKLVDPTQSHISPAEMSGSPEQAMLAVFMSLHALISYLKKRKRDSSDGNKA